MFFIFLYHFDIYIFLKIILIFFFKKNNYNVIEQ